MGKLKILVCCHKETNYLHNDVFQPILLGADNAPASILRYFDGLNKDNEDENISYLHPYLAELTAIYWAWKNYDMLGSPDRIGLFHYRRYFNFKKKVEGEDPWQYSFFDFSKATQSRYGWERDSLNEFCAATDLVVTESEWILDPRDWTSSATLEEHYKYSHYPEDFDLTMDTLCELYPEYQDVVDKVRYGHYGHYCNMFIMTRELFFEYAEWLFSILFTIKDKLNLSSNKYAGEQKRVLGFLGERLLSFFVEYKRQNSISIKECQRLIGYLTASEKWNYIKKYGAGMLRDIKKNGDSQIEEEAIIRQEDAGNGIVETEILVGDSGELQPQSPLVSIVVPMYNVEAYLRECLDSLVQQTLEDIEIICIDNGSSDNCANIVKEYMPIDPRVRLISFSKNKGLAGARNAGQLAANGEYVAHVDGDDICSLDMFEKLFSKAKKLNADIVVCSVYRFVGTVDNAVLHRPLEWFDKSEEALPITQRPQLFLEPAAWNKLFRRDYINEIGMDFITGSSFGDEIPGITSAYIQTQKIATVQEGLYFYRGEREGSITKKMHKEYVDYLMSSLTQQQRILDKHNFKDEHTLSYIVEFKFSVVCYLLADLEKDGRKYFFAHISKLFKEQDHLYLKRYFDYFPLRRRLYWLIYNRKYNMYRFMKTLLPCYNTSKAIAKKILKPSYNGLYREFKLLGLIRFRFFRKRFAEQTVNILNSTVCEQYSLIQHQNTIITDNNQTINTLEYQIQQNAPIKKYLEERIKSLEDEKAEIVQISEYIREQVDILEVEKKQLESQHKTEIQLKQAEIEQKEEVIRQRDSQIEGLQSVQVALQQQIAGIEQQIEPFRQHMNLLEQEVASKRDYYKDVWCTGWIEYWKQYYLSNIDALPDKIVLLKSGLDLESIELIDIIAERNFFLLPYQRYTDYFLYNHTKIFTEKEKVTAKTEKSFEDAKNQFTIPEELIMEPSVFHYHGGLKLLPFSVLESIKGKAVIDGGAYWGDTALVFSLYHPSSIHCFEPSERNRSHFAQVMEQNHLENIHIVPMGLSNKDSKNVLYQYEMDSGASFFNVKPTFQEKDIVQENEVETTSIDNYVKKNNIEVGFIKLDIEGNEYAAIMGACDTIISQRPVLSIAIYHQPIDFFEIKPLIESWNLNYEFSIRKLVGHDLVTEVILLAYPRYP